MKAGDIHPYVNNTELPPYFTLDVSFSQTIKIVTIFAKIDNIVNHLYTLTDGYPMPGGSVTPGVKINVEKDFNVVPLTSPDQTIKQRDGGVKKSRQNQKFTV